MGDQVKTGRVPPAKKASLPTFLPGETTLELGLCTLWPKYRAGGCDLSAFQNLKGCKFQP